MSPQVASQASDSRFRSAVAYAAFDLTGFFARLYARPYVTCSRTMLDTAITYAHKGV